MSMEEQRLEGKPEQESVTENRAVSSGADDIRREARETLDPRRILWQPSPEQIAQSNVAAFVRFLEENHGSEAPSVWRLYEWSIEKPEEFWRSFLHFSGMVYEGDDTRVLSYVPGSRSERVAPHPDPLPMGEGALRMIDARWFPDVRFNFAENLLRTAEERPWKEAMAFFAEDGRERHITFGELKQEAARFSQVLDDCGVQQGDRVVASMPNIPETVAAMLAVTARGAIWSSIAPSFGADTVIQRFGQLDPKVLIAADGHLFRGKVHSALENVRAIAERIPSIEHTIIIPYVGADCSPLPLCKGGGVGGEGSCPYTRLPFDHPLFILFSSGTEGPPKCIVHGAGGTLLNQLKQHTLHTNLTASDTFFFHTETSWMMWNSLVSGLGTGAKIVLYDGDPFARSGRMLWDIMEKERVAVFGTGAALLAKMEKNGVHPRTTHNLSYLRTILSTGSRLYGSQFDYVYEHVHPTVQLASTSGGTDIMGAFATASPVLPVHREELQTLSLGYKVEVFDDDGYSLTPGLLGELVCTAPFPSQPVGFWNDPGHKRYLAAYFQKYGPTVWHHGDTVELTPSGGMVIHERSDDTIKVGGVRIGPAEITMQAESIPEVLASAAIGHYTGEGGRIVLFVVLREGQTLTDDLQARIRAQIRAGASPHHVPSVICAVHDFPRTHNGKVSLKAIRSVVHGKEVGNLDSLSNPEPLAHFRDRPELAV